MLDCNTKQKNILKIDHGETPGCICEFSWVIDSFKKNNQSSRKLELNRDVSAQVVESRKISTGDRDKSHGNISNGLNIFCVGERMSCFFNVAKPRKDVAPSFYVTL